MDDSLRVDVLFRLALLDEGLWINVLLLWVGEDLLLLNWLLRIDLLLIHVSLTNSLLSLLDGFVDCHLLFLLSFEGGIHTKSTNAAGSAAAEEESKPDQEVTDENKTDDLILCLISVFVFIP